MESSCQFQEGAALFKQVSRSGVGGGCFRSWDLPRWWERVWCSSVKAGARLVEGKLAMRAEALRSVKLGQGQKTMPADILRGKNLIGDSRDRIDGAVQD